MKIDKIKTDAIPLVNELVYYLKKLCLHSVIKDEDRALSCETLESIKASDLYIACMEQRADFYFFDYNYKDLLNVGIPDYLILDYLKDKSKIPYKYREELIKRKSESYIKNYIELNNYYRMLNGLPEVGDNEFIYITDDILPEELSGTYNSEIPIHKLSDNQNDLLYSFGVIDILKTRYPKAKYLDYLGSNRIDIYNARCAARFKLLRMDRDVPKEVSSRFVDKYEQNRVYTLKVVYNEAFKLGSDYYNNFIAIFILLQTMIDILAEMPDFIIKRDLFDIQMIKLFFEYHGVDFFSEIPMIYQKRMVRNLNKLLKYKSTTKNIVDICSLFGFENIEVFKYYLLKERQVDKFGEFIYNYDENGNEDITKDFDLKFLKVPIHGNPDDYIHNKRNYNDYDDIVSGDAYWNGELDHEYIKNAIMEKEFNYIQSKYLSVDTIYSMEELTFQLVYFYNMLFDDVILENLLKIPIPPINSVAMFRFTDVICYLFSLSYLAMGLEDDLHINTEEIMEIKGFNFDADMSALASYIKSKGYTMEDLGIADFQIPKKEVISYQQLMYIFTKNKEIHDHVVHEMVTANNKNIYDIYKKIYDSLMINNLSLEFFRKSDGTIATSYMDFLKDRDLILYQSLMKIRTIDSDEVRISTINEQVDQIVYIIETYLESEEFDFLFSRFPGVSAEAVKRYLYLVVNFYKSYKINIHSINTIYKFDDALDNKIIIIDKVLLNYIYSKYDTIEALGKANITSKLPKKEYIKLLENISFDITYWLDAFFDDDLDIRENIKSILVNLNKEDCPGIHDFKFLESKLKKSQWIEVTDIPNIISKPVLEDDGTLLENLVFDITYWLEVFGVTNIKSDDVVNTISNLYKLDSNCIFEKFSVLSDKKIIEKTSIRDSIKISNFTE